MAGLGIALSLATLSDWLLGGEDYPLRRGPWRLGGFVPLFLGPGLILLHFLVQKD